LEEGLHRLYNVVKIQETKEIKGLADDIIGKLVSKAVYNPPIRQLSELITIIAYYITELLS